MSEVWLEPGAHGVRFYDSASAAHASIAEFLTANPTGNDPMLMVVRRSTFEGVTALLASGRYGPPIPAERIYFVDADEAVRAVTDDGVVNLARAEILLKQAVVEARRHAGGSDGTLRWYGEGVDVLCALGDFEGALGIETLATRMFAFDPRMVILCGYQRGQFVEGKGMPHLHAVYGAHTHVAPIEGAQDYPPSSEGGDPPPSSGATRLHDIVYVVDDDASIRRSLKRLLMLSNLQSAVFESAEAFLADLDGLKPGVLLADIQLGGGMGGHDLLAHMQTARPTWPKLAMSGSDDDNAARDALRLGARAFLKKPFESQALLDAVAAALNATS